MSVKPVNGRRMSMAEIRREGFRALVERLGAGGAMRFLAQYDPGRGDYTAERHEWLNQLSNAEIVESIRRRQGQ